MTVRSDVLIVLLAGTLAIAACRSRETSHIEPVYDPQTGKLQLLKSDSNGDGKIDTWSHMDGTRILRIELDTDGDGTVDRWEYYDAAQHLEKVGMSRANDGHEDAWSYVGARRLDRTDRRFDETRRQDQSRRVLREGRARACRRRQRRGRQGRQMGELRRRQAGSGGVRHDPPRDARSALCL